MRWKINNPSPKEGNIRRRNKFAFFPTVVGDYRVWLEKYQVTEECTKYIDASYGKYMYTWTEVSRRTLEHNNSVFHHPV